jgi:hypothetical protein
MGSSLINAWLLVKCTYRTYNMLLKIPTFTLYTSSLSAQAYLTCLTLQRQLSHLNLRFIAAKIKFTLRLAVYRQSISLGTKTLEVHDRHHDCWPSVYSLGTDCTENSFNNSSFIVWYVPFAAITQQSLVYGCLFLCRYLATGLIATI